MRRESLRSETWPGVDQGRISSCPRTPARFRHNPEQESTKKRLPSPPAKYTLAISLTKQRGVRVGTSGNSRCWDGEKMQGATVIAGNSHEITILDDCRRAIAEADNLDQLSDLRSRAEAIRVWAKSANESLEVQNRAAELRLLAERKAGKMLSQMGLKGGDRKSNGHDDRLKLSDLGITHNQSKRWQRAATISDQQFTDYVKRSSKLGQEITGAGLLRLATPRPAKQSDTTTTRPLKYADPDVAHRHFDIPVTKTAASDTCGKSPGHLQDAMNHVNLLQQVLTPYANGASEGLSKGEKRAVLYLLSEVQTLLQAATGEANTRE